MNFFTPADNFPKKNVGNIEPQILICDFKTQLFLFEDYEGLNNLILNGKTFIPGGACTRGLLHR